MIYSIEYVHYFWLDYQLLWDHVRHIPILLRTASLAFRQSYDQTNINEVTLTDMGKMSQF